MTALKIISIALKPIQIVLLGAGLGAVAYFTKELHDAVKPEEDSRSRDPYDVGNFGRYEFFLYATGVGLVFAVAGFVLALMGLLQKKYWAFAMSAVQAICALQLLVSTALLAKVLTTYQEEPEVLGIKFQSTCDKLDEEENREYDYTCSQLTGGVVFGFLAMVLFTVDTFISFASFIQSKE